MGIFGSKIELDKKIKEQAEQITRLENIKQNYEVENKDLRDTISRLSQRNKAYEDKYVNTKLECSFCYTKLLKEYVFCPKCGKKVEWHQENVSSRNNEALFTVEPDGNCVYIKQYNGFDDKKIMIPSCIGGKPVNGIWNETFLRCEHLEEVYFEEGCKYIGSYAFCGCSNLKKVRLPKSLEEIGAHAFASCAIEEIAIPPKVKFIGDGAFSVRSLKHVILPEDLKYIGYSAFQHTSIQEIAFPQSLLYIDTWAFADTKLREVVLPDNLFGIGRASFDTPTLGKIVMHSNIKALQANIFGKNKKVEIYCSAGSKGQLYARRYGLPCHEIASVPKVSLEPGVTKIRFTTRSLNREHLFQYLGVSKMSMWAWESSMTGTAIKKYFDKKEAVEMQQKLRSYGQLMKDKGCNGHPVYSVMIDGLAEAEIISEV